MAFSFISMELESSRKDCNDANWVAFWCFHGYQANVVWFFNFGWKWVFDIASLGFFPLELVLFWYNLWAILRAWLVGFWLVISVMWIGFIVEGLRWRCIGNEFIVEGLRWRCIGNGFTVEGLWRHGGVQRRMGRRMRYAARVCHVGDLDSESSNMDFMTTRKSSASSHSACDGSTASSSGGVGGFQ